MIICESGSQTSHLPVERVFRECFHDDDIYIDLYKQWLLPASDVVGMMIDGNTAGLITYFPVTLVDGKTQKPAAHSYALGTFAKYRGHGVARELMLACDHEMSVRGYGAHIGCPDSYSLFDYYDRIGYLAKSRNVLLRLPQQIGCSHEHAELSRCNVTPEAYRRIREDFYLPRTPFVSYPLCVYEYYMRELQIDGSLLLSARVGERDAGLVLCAREDSHIIVRDLLVSDADAGAVLCAVRAMFPDSDISVLLPACSLKTALNIGTADEYTVMCGKPLDAGGELGFAGTLSNFEHCFCSLMCHIRIC